MMTALGILVAIWILELGYILKKYYQWSHSQ